MLLPRKSIVQQRWAWWICATAVVLSACVGRTAEAQEGSGTVSGRVVDEVSGQPVAEVQIVVIGTNIGGRSGADGQFTIRGVPSGATRLRALRIGYAEKVESVVVAAGETATVNFSLAQLSVMLGEVVTTATGMQRRVELGNTVATIDASDITEQAAVATITDVLNARTAGVQITAPNATGVGARVRIRGASSLNLSNEPIYIIDGIRMTSDMGSSQLGTGGPQPSRVGDINPEEIESMEVVKGPSAATLYGTDAANGVIVITTKRGQAGPPQWQVWGEGGLVKDVVNNYPVNYTIAGHSPGSTAYRDCTLPQISAGSCVQDSVRTLDLINDSYRSPVGTGNRYQMGASITGGTSAVRYFLSGEREQETGVLTLPQFERDRMQAEGVNIDPWVSRPNAYDKKSFRANLGTAVTPQLDVNVQAGFVMVDQRFQQDANSTAGLGSHLFGGKGYADNGTVAGTGTPLEGYRAWTPGYTFQEKNAQRVNRFITSADMNWRPLSWLQMNAVIGYDYTGRADQRLRLRGQGPPLNSTYRDGYAQDSRASVGNLTTNLAATAKRQLRDWISSSTTVGVQYVNYNLNSNSASGTDLPPGAQTAGAGASPSASQSTVLNKTLGFFVEEQFGFNERLFITGALRSDQNSAFGTEFQSVLYPKASVSWIMSDEGFFPELTWMDQFRFRASYGSSGRQPGPNDALRTFQSTTANIDGVDSPGIVYNAIGNTALKPEQTSEFETGFDTRLFGGRASFELTYYHKRTKDALIQAVVPPSLGAAASVNQNLGSVRNIGWEGLLIAQLVDHPSFGFDVAVNASTNDNLVVSLGETAPQVTPTSQVLAGYPLFNYYARKISGWDDKNGDGILTYSDDPAANEVFVDDSASFIGEAAPKYNVAVTPTLELLGRKLRLSALFDYRGGFHWYNLTGEFRCASRGNCPGLSNPESSFEEQAASVARRDHPSRTSAGYIEKGDFVALREISATYTLPADLLGIAKVRSLSLNLAARNVALWTGYTGINPESFYNGGDTGNSRGQDFQSLGPASYFIARINIGF